FNICHPTSTVSLFLYTTLFRSSRSGSDPSNKNTIPTLSALRGAFLLPKHYSFRSITMAGTSARNVAVGKPNLAVSGGVLTAPVGTERPTSFDGPYDSAYVSVGYVSDEGVTESSERSTEEI